jgi:hypothetical protein
MAALTIRRSSNRLIGSFVIVSSQNVARLAPAHTVSGRTDEGVADARRDSALA